MLRQWAKKWGPTIAVLALLGAPAATAAAWLAPRVLFMILGSGRVDAVEVQVARVVRYQRTDCLINQWLLWWVSVNSEKQGWVTIPPHVLAMLQRQDCGATSAEDPVPVPPVGGPSGGAIAGEWPQQPTTGEGEAHDR